MKQSLFKTALLSSSFLLPVTALAQTGYGPTPPAAAATSGVPATGGTFTGPLVINTTLTGVYGATNSVPGSYVSQYFQVDNKGPASGIGFAYHYRTEATSGGFDGGSEFVDDVRVDPVGTNHPAYDLFFDWILGPSDSTNPWGIGTEFDISNRMPTTPGWHLSRGVSTFNVGNYLAAVIATSSVGSALTSPFTTVNGSSTVTVVDPAHMLQTGQYVSFAGASACGGLTLNGAYAVTKIDANDYSVNAGSNATSSATCGGSVTTTQANGTDAEWAFAVGPSADVNTGTGRYARFYQGFNCEPNFGVGKGIDPNAHGAVCVEASGAGFSLAANPITTNGTTTVSLAWRNSGLTTSGVNSTFVISGATAVGGFTASGIYTVLSVNSTTVTFSTGGATPTAANGGGVAVIAYGSADLPDAAFEVPFGSFNYGFRSDQGTFTGDAIHLGTGQTIGAAGTAGVPVQASATNNNAPAGYVGEYLSNSSDVTITNTVTITIATPAVITQTAHGYKALTPVYFHSTGALPTGINAFTTYYITAGTVTANTYQLSTTLALALAGTSIATSGTQSGVQSSNAGDILSSGGNFDVIGLQLNAGDYDCQAMGALSYGGSTSVTLLNGWLGTAGASILPTTPTNIFATAAKTETLPTATIAPNDTIVTGTLRVSLAASGMAVFSVNNTYTASTMSVSGSLRCRRAR